ncbi:toll-like receptor 13 [Mya arenaria]|uniref:toll-like receptor 13 n=1 Tax=Mya arenaria TaxID=6604 RepID=UPI0022E829DB|nr:toll-like receptor 13 [Mya arenaria]
MPNRDDLLCDSSCDQQLGLSSEYFSDEHNKCCVCLSCTLLDGHEISLALEYTSVLGRNVVIVESLFNESALYMIESTNGDMTDFPSNVCGWDTDKEYLEQFAEHRMVADFEKFNNNIYRINFGSNKIKIVPDISCLANLDTLNLRDNRISHLGNMSFSNLSRLRNLDISLNNIQTIDPKTLFTENVFLLRVNLSDNKLTVADVSNLVSLHPLCEVDLKSNEIESLTNNLGITLDTGLNYGPGFINLQENHIFTFPDLQSLLKLKDLNLFGKLLHFGFDLRGAPLHCDCHMQPYHSLAINSLKALWRDYFAIKCTSPPELKDVLVFELDPFDLVCELRIEDGCPKGCTCLDVPENDTVYVDCSNSRLNQMPIGMPESTFSKYIHLNLSNNHIKDIRASYLTELSYLDVSGNTLSEIDEETTKRLQNTSLDISSNRYLRVLPRNLQYRNLCETKLSHLAIDCTCDNIWIQNWIKTKDCPSKTDLATFMCYMPNLKQSIPATAFTPDVAECELDKSMFKLVLIVVACLTPALLVIGVFVYIFRYELLVAWLRMNRKYPGKEKCFEYDVGITFNVDDEKLRKWVGKELVPRLKQEGFRVYRAYVDANYGAPRDNDVAEVFAKCRNFLLILSDSYINENAVEDDFEDLDEPKERRWTENEWKFAWNQYKSDNMKNLIIVNYDHVSASDVKHRQIKAVMRVGHVVSFCNNNANEVLDNIVKKIGSVKKIQQARRKSRKGVIYTVVKEMKTNNLAMLNKETRTVQCLQQGITYWNQSNVTPMPTKNTRWKVSFSQESMLDHSTIMPECSE